MERDCWEFICGAPTTFQGYGLWDRIDRIEYTNQSFLPIKFFLKLMFLMYVKFEVKFEVNIIYHAFHLSLDVCLTVLFCMSCVYADAWIKRRQLTFHVGAPLTVQVYID